jgi:hypothetical protein
VWIELFLGKLLTVFIALKQLIMAVDSARWSLCAGEGLFSNIKPKATDRS